MGLDSVELLIEVEDRFGLTIPDERAAEIETVGDLWSAVLFQLDTAGNGLCGTQRIFYQLRRCLPLPQRKWVRPDTPLTALFSPENLRGDYEELALQSGLKFPAMQHAEWYRWLNVTLILGLVISASVVVDQNVLLSLLITDLRSFAASRFSTADCADFRRLQLVV